MGWLTNIKKGASKVVRAGTHGVLTAGRATAAGSNPIMAGIKGASAAASNYGRSPGLPALSSSTLPALPGFPGGGGGGTIMAQRVPAFPLPMTTADFQEWEKMGFWLPLAKTPVMPNPPKGYVVVRYASGGSIVQGCMRKEIAIKAKLWRAGKKPPITVGEHQALVHAASAIKKVRKFNGLISYVDKNTNNKGKVLIGRKKRK